MARPRKGVLATRHSVVWFLKSRYCIGSYDIDIIGIIRIDDGYSREDARWKPVYGREFCFSSISDFENPFSYNHSLEDYFVTVVFVLDSLGRPYNM